MLNPLPSLFILQAGLSGKRPEKLVLVQDPEHRGTLRRGRPEPQARDRGGPGGDPRASGPASPSPLRRELLLSGPQRGPCCRGVQRGGLQSPLLRGPGGQLSRYACCATALTHRFTCERVRVKRQLWQRAFGVTQPQSLHNHTNNVILRSRILSGTVGAVTKAGHYQGNFHLSRGILPLRKPLGSLFVFTITFLYCVWYDMQCITCIVLHLFLLHFFPRRRQTERARALHPSSQVPAVVSSGRASQSARAGRR